MIGIDAAIDDGDVDVDALVNTITLAVGLSNVPTRSTAYDEICEGCSGTATTGECFLLITPSTSTAAIAGLFVRAVTCLLVRSAEKPPIESNTWVSARPCAAATSAALYPDFTITTYDLVRARTQAPELPVGAVRPTGAGDRTTASDVQ